MPSEIFMRLKFHKKNAIMEAACRELADESCNNLQIGRLAARMQISRSAFYSYFHNRRDFLCCLLYYLYDSVLDDFLYCLQTEDGDFQEACIRAVSRMKEDKKWELYASLCQRFINEKEYQEIAVDTVKEYHESGKIREFTEACYGKLDPERYGFLEKDKLECGIILVLDIILCALYTYGADSTDEEWEALLCRLRIIGRGLQRLSSEQKIHIVYKSKLKGNLRHEE